MVISSYEYLRLAGGLDSDLSAYTILLPSSCAVGRTAQCYYLPAGMGSYGMRVYYAAPGSYFSSAGNTGCLRGRRLQYGNKGRNRLRRLRSRVFILQSGAFLAVDYWVICPGCTVHVKRSSGVKACLRRGYMSCSRQYICLWSYNGCVD